MHPCPKVWVALACFLLCATHARAQAAAFDQPAVNARIATDVIAAAPLRPFRVAVIFALKPGWHVYWKYAGDSGSPTTVTLTAPAGWTVGDLQFPAPHRFDEPGNIVAYGYQNELVVWATTTPPADAKPGSTVELTADTAWLCCAKVCVPGDQKLSLRLPVAADAAPDAPTTKLLATWTESAPKPVEARVTGLLTDQQRSTSISVNVELPEGAAKPEFFPVPPPEVVLGEATLTLQGRRAAITFPARLLKDQPLPSRKMEGVLAYTDAAGVRRAVSFDIPLAASAIAPVGP